MATEQVSDCSYQKFLNSIVHLPKWIKNRFCSGLKTARRPPVDTFDAPGLISRDEMIREARRTLKMNVDTDYNFGVCGAQGVGKSYFINSIRCLPPADKFTSETSSAPTDCFECTMEAQRYRFPLSFRIPNIAIWDLPGYGTPAFPSGGYFENSNITLYAFDFLILICRSTLNEFDLQLLKECHQWKVPVAVLINQVDGAIEGEKQKEEAKKKASLTEAEYGKIVHDTVCRIKEKVMGQIRNADISRTENQQITVWAVSALFQLKFIESRPIKDVAETNDSFRELRLSQEAADARTCRSDLVTSNTTFNKDDILAETLEDEMAKALDHCMKQAAKRRYGVTNSAYTPSRE